MLILLDVEVKPEFQRHIRKLDGGLVEAYLDQKLAEDTKYDESLPFVIHEVTRLTEPQ